MTKKDSYFQLSAVAGASSFFLFVLALAIADAYGHVSKSVTLLIFLSVAAGLISLALFIILGSSLLVSNIEQKNKKGIVKLSSSLVYPVLILFLTGFFVYVYNRTNNATETMPKETQTSVPTYEASGNHDAYYGYTDVQIENAINLYRQEKGLVNLEKHKPLCDLAKVRVYEVKTNWSHQGFQERAETDLYDKFCNQPSQNCSSVGENLARGYTSVEEIISGWDRSPEHKKNMVGDYNVQCVASSENHVVSLFAKVDSQFIQSQTSNDLVVNAGSNVAYNYAKVREWEDLLSRNRENMKSWEGDSGFYEEKDTIRIVKEFEKMIGVGNKIWDGYTNSNITNSEVQTLEQQYWDINEALGKLISDAGENAYENCVDEWADLEDEFGGDYDDEKKDCKDYLD